MKKAVLFAAILSVPLFAIGFREAGRLFAGLSDPRQSSPASLLWLFGIAIALGLIWISVLVIATRGRPQSGKLPFAAAAAIAMREAKKRLPAANCPRCGRARISDSVPKCLYCGATIISLP